MPLPDHQPSRERNLSRPVRSLLFSTLYPSSVRPTHGIFVETRLRHLLASGAVETRVVAPVPWFPSQHPRFGDWSRIAATPLEERRNGIQVQHPRYLLPPKLGMNIAPLMLALGARQTIARLIAEGFDFDLIDAHYYYPDGVAAALLARWFNKPFVVTARGTDLNLIPRHMLPRRMIRWTAQQAAASIGVCRALLNVLQDMGIAHEQLHVLRNGVDLERFRPAPPAAARTALGLPQDRTILLSVGHLIERKGHHLVIEAIARLPAHVCLYIIGGGEEADRLRAQIAALDLKARVFMMGPVPNDQLYLWYSAATALILASSREGWANVLLEAMACGTPALATDVDGSGEVVAAPEAGLLMRERSADAIVSAVLQILAHLPERAATRRYAEGFSWDETTQGQIELFNAVARKNNQSSRR